MKNTTTLRKFCDVCDMVFYNSFVDPEKEEHVIRELAHRYRDLKESVDDCRHLKAKRKGEYKVIGVDTFDGTDFVIDEVTSLKTALKVAKEKSGEMLRTYVYDYAGKEVSGGNGNF